MATSSPIRRGCGYRIRGGIYWELDVSVEGGALDDFLIDPPALLPPNLNIGHVGTTSLERNGVMHLIDWVGSRHYQDVAVFWEECRRHGVSRRLSSRVDFSRITRESRLLLVHARAHIDNCQEYETWTCPKFHEHHNPEHLGANPPPMCAGVWWEDLSPHSEDFVFEGRDVSRLLPDGDTLRGRLTPSGVEPVYRPAIFASVPCSAISVVRGNGHEDALRAAMAAAPNVTVRETDV